MLKRKLYELENIFKKLMDTMNIMESDQVKLETKDFLLKDENSNIKRSLRIG